MKKYVLLIGLLAGMTVINGCGNVRANSSQKVVSNKAVSLALTTTVSDKDNIKRPDIEEARNFESSLKNGSVIMISREDSNELEVYNIASLDKFIEQFNSGKQGYVRIIKGRLKDGNILVNKLEELESDGKSVKNIGYDCYSNKNKFIPVKPNYFPKVGKSDTEKSLRYTLCPTKETPDSEGALLISFNKSSIKN